MGPLSVIHYYKNNKKRFLSIYISVILSVILLYTLQMVIFSMYRTGSKVAIEPKKYYSTVAPKGELLNEFIIDNISQIEGVQKVIPCVFDVTTIHAGIGVNYSTTILSIKMESIVEMLDLMKLHVCEGRLPENKYEILLHKHVAANKNLSIGDSIGRMVSKTETLPGSYHITGIIDGSSLVSFAPIESYIETYHLPYEYIYGGLVLPKENSLKQMNENLDAMMPINYQIDTLTVQMDWQKEYTTKFNILLSVANIFIILIVSSCIGFLFYIYFSQRRSEFGLLWAIGFSRQKVINRAFAEVNFINLLGFVSGILISILIGLFLNYIYFTPIGDSLQIVDLKYVLGAAGTPVFVTLFSLIPIWRSLKKLDPISIIDGSLL